MTTIVAPTDFSPMSLNAVDYAVNWAVADNKKLWLLHVCELPVAFSEIPVPQSDIDSMIIEAERKMKSLKQEIIDKTIGTIEVYTAIRSGDVIYQIEDLCKSVGAEVVIIGAETARSFMRLFAGGKTIDAIRELKWPVIMVPPTVKFHKIRNIGLACDFKNTEQTIPLKEISYLIHHFNAVLHVIHVSEESGDALGGDLMVESLWLQNKISDLNPQFHFLENDNEDKSILDFAEKNKLDLLMVIPRKHNLFGSIFKHSHTKDIILHSHVPVMAVHE